jgi:hypothetical protein
MSEGFRYQRYSPVYASVTSIGKNVYGIGKAVTKIPQSGGRNITNRSKTGESPQRLSASLKQLPDN